MKISRLRRVLAVFLSAAMLIMCTPFGGIMAAAADETPLNSVTAYIKPEGGTFDVGGTAQKTDIIFDGKLFTVTLANITPTRDGYVFDGWYVWSASAKEDVLVNDDYTFTDDNFKENESTVTISAKWSEACNKIYTIYTPSYSKLYYGYSTGTPSKTGGDAPHFYLDITNESVVATLTDINWYCVDNGVTFDPKSESATKCNGDIVSNKKDYYLVCTVSIEDTDYRFGDELTARAELGSDPILHSNDTTTATISWQITPYEVITELSDISITPDITSYKLEPGKVPTGFTGTANYTTKIGTSGEIECAGVAWVEEETGEVVYDDIVEGKNYIPRVVFALPSEDFLPVFYVEERTNIETDSASFSCNMEESFVDIRSIVLNGKAITAAASTEYTITFDANGGALPEGTETTATTTGGKLTTLPTPTLDGYTFKGWFDAATDGNEVTTETPFSKDTTIYAQWEAASSSGFSATAYFKPEGGTFSDGTTSAKSVTITDGKLPAGTLASLTLKRLGYVFDGWYVWSASANHDVLVDDDYTFTDDNVKENESTVTISAQWYKAYNNIYVSDQSSLYYGYSTGTPSKTGDDAPLFYLDTNGFAKATLTDINWYCVNSGSTFDLDSATLCNGDTVSNEKDYYLVCTVSVGITAYRFGDELTAQAQYGSKPTYTIHSKDSKTATISWQITPYEVITELSDISITPDVTSSSYKLAPGDSPTGFTGTATYTTKSGKTGKINCLAGVWVEEAEDLYWDNAVDTIEDGSSYVPMFAFEFPGQYYVPASIDYFNVDGMTNLETDSDSYSFDVENSFEAIVLNAEAITASAGSSVLDKPIEYLEDVTLTPVSGDTTGTKFEFGSIPIIPFEDFEAGYKYIYIVFPDDDPKSAVEIFNKVKNGQINVKDTYYAMPLSFAADLPTAQTAQITVGEKAAVFIAKVNTNYVTELAYYTFALKVFAVTPENKAEKAAKDITTALGDIKPTNDTTEDDIKAIVDKNKGETTATVTTFTLTPATTEADGSLKVTVAVTDGTNTETVEKTYTIEKLPAAPENKAEKAAKDITTALGDIKPTNDTTKDDIQAIVDKNKGETTATVTTFTLNPATEDEDGSLTVTVTVSDGTNTETVEKTYTIDKLPKHEHKFGDWTVVKEATATEEGLLRRTCTVEGCTEVEEKTIPKLEESKGESESGNVVDTTPEDNSFSAAIPDVTYTAENIELTPDESAAIADGSTLSIFLKVTENLSDDKKEDEKAITDKADSEELTIGSFLDVSLFKQINDDTPVAVTETKKPIKVSFIVPDDLIAEGRAYYIIRTHGSETTVIECEFDAATKTCTFETDKFSSYAIAYKAAPAEEDDIEKFVERLYNYMLGRHSDPEGKANHVANLRNGETAVKVSFDFVYSDEFKNMGLTNKEIAERLYLTFLDRTPDEAGLADWTATLDGGCSIGHLFYGFTQSNEFTELCEKYGIVRGDWTVMETRDVSSKLTAFVSRLYTKALNRTFDVNGLNNHTANYIANHDLYQLAYDFIFSSEFTEKELSDEDFVDTMYRTFFDREGDPDGRADWIGKLKSGMSREEVLAGFVGSQECADLVAKFGI